MIGWIFGLLGVGAVGGLVALYVLAPTAFLAIWTAVKAIFEALMKVSVPLLLAGLVLLAVAGGLIWRWGVAAHGRHVAEAQVDSLTTALDQCSSNLKIANDNTATLQARLDEQNARVDALKAEGDARTARANAAIRKAQEQARVLQGRIARLQAARPASGDLCASARSLIIDTLSEERK